MDEPKWLDLILENKGIKQAPYSLHTVLMFQRKSFSWLGNKQVN